MVIGGAVFHDGLLSVALRFEGQSADVVTAARLVLPEPPAGAGVVGGGRSGLGGRGGGVGVLRLGRVAEDGVGDSEHHAGHDDHRDDPPEASLPLLSLLLGGQTGLPAGLLTLAFLGGHGPQGTRSGLACWRRPSFLRRKVPDRSL